MSKRYKILAISPYENLSSIIETVASKYNEIKVTAYTGNLQDGALLAQQHISEGYDVILSRGGTASLIKKAVPIPVMEISISADDVLRSILLLENLSAPYAIVGHPALTDSAHILSEMMNYELKIVTVRNMAETEQILSGLKNTGIQYILCDVVTEFACRKLGLEPILVNSGVQSVRLAIENTISFLKAVDTSKANIDILSKALNMHRMKTIIIRDDGSIVYSTYNDNDINTVVQYLHKLTRVQNFRPSKNYHTIEDRLFSITAKQASYGSENCYIFCLEENPAPVGGSKHGLRSYDELETKVAYSSSFYSVTTTAKAMEERIAQINQKLLPVMILGERGTGKDQLAKQIYLDSRLVSHPFISIECQTINEKTWKYLVSSYNSPFNDRENTIFISNIQMLNEKQHTELLSMLVDTNAYKRNRIILSCSQSVSYEGADPARNFIDYLSCAVITLPPIRTNAENIKNAASIYLNTLNLKMSKQIVGFTPEALSLILSFQWPGNFMELNRVLSELVLKTEGSYIQESDVAEALENEKKEYKSALSAGSFDYNRTLDEITRDVISTVLVRCGGNQTLAAKKLGIGRTTLWRYINNNNL